MMDGYVSGWRAYDRALRRPPAPVSSLTRGGYWLSANVIKADEDKTYPGAFVASPTDPWGQSVPATTTHPGWTYRSVFARDGYETFTGLEIAGLVAASRLAAAAGDSARASLYAAADLGSGPVPAAGHRPRQRAARRPVITAAVARGCPCDRMGSGDG